MSAGGRPVDADVVLVAEQLRQGAPDGISTYTAELARRVAAMGDAAPRLVLWASRPPAGADDPVARLGPMATSPLPHRLMVRAWDVGLAGPQVGAAVVHSPSLLTPPARGASLTTMVHDLAWRRFPDTFPAWGRRWHEAALRRALSRSAVLMAPSTASATDLLVAGAEVKRIEVVEHGCDHLAGPDPEGASALLRRIGVDGPYLLSVSTLEPRKNLARLVEAYAAARPRLPEPWPLVLAGPAGWGPGLGTPPAGVVLAGAVAGGVLTALYQQARAFAYVPLWEGFGLPAVEAMGCGVPVVATPMPSTGDAALEVSPDDVAAMADALVTACVDDDARRQLVANGRARSGELTWGRSARRHVELWKAVADGSDPRSRRR